MVAILHPIGLQDLTPCPWGPYSKVYQVRRYIGPDPNL